MTETEIWHWDGQELTSREKCGGFLQTRKDKGEPMIENLEEIPEVERIERVALKPGEVVVIFSKRTLLPQQIEAIERLGKAAFPNNKLVILEDELDLKVVSAEQVE